MIRKLLAHPLTRNLDIDAPESAAMRERIIREKPFLRRIYEEWYGLITGAIPDGEGKVLELGSAGGFLREHIRDLVTSDILDVPAVDLMVDARRLPFGRGELRGIAMTNVLHHLSDVRRFFRESGRCVRPGGVIAMVEPWRSVWSSFVYRTLHHEPFDPDAGDWNIPPSGPLSGANGALPWMIFRRDSDQFMREFPCWELETIQPMMPFRYLLSGGVSMRSLMPSTTFSFWRGLERGLAPLSGALAMFAFIVLRRTASTVPQATVRGDQGET